MSFESLGLRAELVRAVTERGYTTPTPIQSQAIPVVLSGGDLLAGAQTGTGKTAGFVLPILQRLAANGQSGTPSPLTRVTQRGQVRVLILTPTRELAAQVRQSVVDYSTYLPVKSLAMFGGVGMNPQIDALRNGVDVLVATPGRLLDHAGQRTVDLSRVEVLVLDEADRMLDMGFLPDIKRVMKLLPAKRQSLMFSATYSEEIKRLAEGLLIKPALIEVARRNAAAEAIEQKVYLVDKRLKRALLAHLIREHNWYQVLVFTRTKHGANNLALQLCKDGIQALPIHGNKSQNARTRALAEFKDGSLQVLVATDIAARGLDIVELPHVVNFELPNVPEDYVHRIGRTGRAGAQGEAISLVCVDELAFLADIEKLIKRSLPRSTIDGFDYDPNARPEPILQGRRSGGAPAQGQRRGERAPSGQRASSGQRVTPSPHATPGQRTAPTQGATPNQRTNSGQRTTTPGPRTAPSQRNVTDQRPAPGQRAAPVPQSTSSAQRPSQPAKSNRPNDQRAMPGSHTDPRYRADGPRRPAATPQPRAAVLGGAPAKPARSGRDR